MIALYTMKVLIACEESQVVCKAFREIGHEAYSNDLIDCSGGHPEWHLKMDCFKAIELIKPDLIIAHPPCTYFANAGLHYLKNNPDRRHKLTDSFEMVRRIWESSVDRICIENPVGWLNTNWTKPDQIIQPYYFGDRELKTTCLWLKNLAPLIYNFNDNLFGLKTVVDRPDPKGFIVRKSGSQIGKKYNYYWRQGKSAKLRSKTFPGIAKAMAEQWGSNNNQR